MAHTSIRRIIVLLVLVVALGGGLAAAWVWSLTRSPTVRPFTNPVASRFAAFSRLNRAKTLAAEAKHAEALVIFDQLASTENGSGYGWDADIQAASSLAGLGRFEAAIERIERCIRTCPFEDQVADAQINRAQIHHAAGQHDEAIVQLRHIAGDQTGYSPRIRTSAMFAMTRIHDQTDRMGVSRAILERIATEFPGPEDIGKKLAHGALAVMTERVESRQGPSRQRLIADGGCVEVDAIGEGITTWTADEGPYLVGASLAIGPDSTLRIMSGTRVHFAVGAGIRVEGTLEAIGTENEPVRFVTLEDDPDREWWDGITVARSKPRPTVTLTRCRISGATTAIRAATGDIRLDHCVFDRCGGAALFAEGDTSLHMTHGTVTEAGRIGVECEARATVRIEDSRIGGAASHGVFLKDTTVPSTVTRVTVSECGGSGLLVRGRDDVTIAQCVIRGNTDHGVHLMDGASTSVLDSTVADNGGTGIRLERRWDAAVRGNQVTRNRGGGIRAEARCAGRIAGNRIESNALFGVHLRLACTPVITSNRIARNEGPGLWLQEASSPRSLQNNQFTDNGNAALRNESATPVDAAHNWWGTTHEDQIAERIHDRRTHDDWGPVTFSPWLRHEPNADTDAPAVNESDESPVSQ